MKPSKPPPARPAQRSPSIRFEAPVRSTRAGSIVRMPAAASKQLPSRGQVAVRATIDGHAFDTVVEPDGEFGHWLRLASDAPEIADGDLAAVELAPLEDWPEPRVPPDLKKAVAAAPPSIRALWQAITPMARWEWVRWVNATRNPDTRKRRVEVAISKLQSGKRRPCCFNLASCTDPDLSKNGKLALE